ncbi:MAG TPA: type VI secretion system baseplate subunit TssE, partial [Paracoccaceae bacterium]|nr:type VI secretion system baseplate subunit TssE [Paracoccaceae bacterium]
FEPRILPGTLQVSLSAEKSQSRAILAFDITGEVWAQPLPLEIYLRTELDVASGDMSIERRR